MINTDSDRQSRLNEIVNQLANSSRLYDEQNLIKVSSNYELEIKDTS